MSARARTQGYVIRRLGVSGQGYYFLTQAGGWTSNLELAWEFKNEGVARIVLRKRLAEIVSKVSMVGGAR